MAKRTVAFISFQFEPMGEAYLFGDPTSRVQKARLNLVVWRHGSDGRPAISETHPLGEAENVQEFNRLIDTLRDDLNRARDAGRDWFAPRRPFWR